MARTPQEEVFGGADLESTTGNRREWIILALGPLE